MARHWIAPVLCMTLACASLAAHASPRDSLTAASADSFNPTGMTVSGNYPLKFVRIQGTHTVQTLYGGARQSAIWLEQDSGQPPIAFTVFGTSGIFEPPQTGDVFLRVPQTVANAHGAWYISFPQVASTTGVVDATWSNLRITFNDGPPAAVLDLGTISPGTVSKTTTMAPGETKWFRFSLPINMNVAVGHFLDIDTEGTALTGGSNDTEITLYNEDGTLVGFDDDDGSGNLSQLTYGVGSRPAFGTSLAYNGRDGQTLSAGTYWLGVRGYEQGAAHEVGWDFANTAAAARTGQVRVSIRTNIGQPIGCGADFNRSGAVEVQDIFDYLNAWFAGCI